MRASKTLPLILVALLVLSFGLAANLDRWFQCWPGNRTQTADPLNVLMGDARRLFANSFFVKADAYYHSGFYPTIYDNNEAFKTPHMAADTGTVAENNQGEETGFMGAPRDFIEKFSRNFIPDHHTHLDQGGPAGDLSTSAEVREILPWLRLSAELNPNDIRTYTVTAYWLRERMNKTDVAEAFLRDGLRANPDSYEILYELGRVYAENKNDPERARNLWLAALRNWQKQESPKTEPNNFLLVEITGHLALLEEKQGNYQQTLVYWEMCKERSPAPAEIQKRIDVVRENSVNKNRNSNPCHYFTFHN